MKKIILLFLLGITQVFTGQELITDGSFESYSTSGGTTIPNGSASAVLSAWEAESGSVTVQQTFTSGTNTIAPSDGSNRLNVGSTYKRVRQNFTGVANTTYKVSFYGRQNQGTGTSFKTRFRIRQNTTTSNFMGDGADIALLELNLTTPMTYYSFTFNTSETDLIFSINISNKPSTFDEISIVPVKEFDGDTDSDWGTAANWEGNTLPTATDDIYIPTGKNVIVSSLTGAISKDLDVNSGGSLTINGGGSLDVNGTPIGNITYNRTLVAGKWHLVSSPVVDETYDDDWITDNGIATSALNTANKGISTYDNSSEDIDTDGVGSDTATGFWRYFQSGTSTFGSSIGYGMIRTVGGPVSFTGTYPKGSKPATVSNASTNKFNLVGNPYPTYLAVSEFFTDNVTAKFTENTIWIYSQGAGAYVPKTKGDDGSFEIAPGQAFFISSGDGTQIEFYEFNGSGATDTFLKTSKTELSLSIKEGENVRNTTLHYTDSATESFDNGYDASKFTGVNTDFDVFTGLISLADKKLARQVLPIAKMENIVTPIGLKVKAGKEITFSIEAQNLPSGVKVFLEDRLENKTIRLDEVNSNYKVTISEALNGVGRFYLHTKSNALSTDDISLANVSIYKTDNSTLRIVGLLNGKANVKMFNILGKQMMNTNFESTGATDISIPRLAKGVYIVQLQTENGSLNKKIILE